MQIQKTINSEEQGLEDFKSELWGLKSTEDQDNDHNQLTTVQKTLSQSCNLSTQLKIKIWIIIKQWESGAF